MGFLARQLLFGGVVPALVTGILLVVLRRRDWARASGWDAAALAAHFFIMGFPPFMAVGLVQALPFIVAVYALWSIVEDWGRRIGPVKWTVWIGRAVLSALPGYVLIRPGLIPSAFWESESLRLVGYAIQVVVLWAVADAIAARSDPRVVAPAWCVAAVGLSGALLLSRSASLSQLAGALAATLTAVTLLAFLRPQVRLTGLAPSAALIGFSLGSLGSIYGLPTASLWLLLASAFVAPGVVAFRAPSGRTVWNAANIETSRRSGIGVTGNASPAAILLSAALSFAFAAGAVAVAFYRFGPPMTF
jgi:hypothetical protein